MAHQRHRFGLIAGVVVHLAAAGLGLTELDGVTEAFEYGYNCSACSWEERVIVASDEERDMHGINLEIQVGCGVQIDFP